MTERTVRLVLVDDHQVVRLGLKALFDTVPHLAVVGEAGTAKEAIEAARNYQPDVILMDVRLPDSSGVEACREIRSENPTTRVLMLTSYADEAAIIDSIVAGACGYLLKQINPDRLVEAVDVVSQGGSLLDPEVTRTVVSWMQRQSTPAMTDPLNGLSDQERLILPLIADGRTNRQIAATLNLTESTVKTYVSNLLQKLHMSRRAEVAAFHARYQHRETR
jgi:two-component system response regulator DevR